MNPHKGFSVCGEVSLLTHSQSLISFTLWTVRVNAERVETALETLIKFQYPHTEKLS